MDDLHHSFASKAMAPHAGREAADDREATAAWSYASADNHQIRSLGPRHCHKASGARNGDSIDNDLDVSEVAPPAALRRDGLAGFVMHSTPASTGSCRSAAEYRIRTVASFDRTTTLSPKIREISDAICIVRNICDISDITVTMQDPRLRFYLLARMAADPDEVWVPGDFADLGNRAAVDKTLQRLVSAGELRRIDHGLYD